MATRKRWIHWAFLALALLLLDISLTFQNIWPTPAVTWRGELSVELAAAVLVLASAWRRLAPLSPRASWAATAVWTVFVVGRYADVTAAALFGRDINLYWDLRFIPDVAALLAAAAPAWLTVAVVAGAVAAVGLLCLIIRWAIVRVGRAAVDARERRVLVILGLVVVAAFVLQHTGAPLPGLRAATPVTATYARQARLVARAMGHETLLPPSPPMTSDLSRVAGADVFVIFLESYGAVSFDRPAFVERLAAPRARLAAAIHDTGRDVVSAFVESPTFGGSSWLAHISLLSGIEVRDADTNALLMTRQRDTLVTNFSRRGYRTVALMPGLWQRWPEGAFYGFDDIYGGGRLGYRGPGFGWFDIPDQFALARLDVIEPPAANRPLFVFFPTISTHTPFHPTPPYQPDWARVLTERPYDADDLARAYDQVPDWLNLSPGYADALAYAYTTLSGYLEQEAGRDFVLVLLGDHQPPALVSGQGAPWDVPVHVIASRRELLDRLRQRGFTQGLTPSRPDLSRMHELLPILLDAFGS